MPLFEPVVPWRYFAPVLRALARVPATLRERAMAAAGLDFDDPPGRDDAIALDRLETLLETVVSEPGHADFGFDAGLCLATHDHGPLLPALLRAPTLEDRLRLQAQYFRLITPIFSWHFERHRRGAELVVRPAATFRPRVLPVIFEYYAAAHAHNVSALLAPSGQTFQMRLPFEPPPHVARYRAIPGVRYRFLRNGLPELKIVYSDAALAVRLNDEPPAQVDERRLDRLQRGIGRSARIGEWARMMLSEAEADRPGADELAALLNMSRRSFERALRSEGIGFRDLSKSVRHQRACAMLQDPAVPVSQIAYRLGYADQASFAHGFKALTGCSPSRYRQGGGRPRDALADGGTGRPIATAGTAAADD